MLGISIESFALMTAVVLVLGLSDTACAQQAPFSSFDTNKSISTTAGFHVTIPFATKYSVHAREKARFGLKLGLTREYRAGFTRTSRRSDVNVLDFGWRLGGHPSMLVNGEDIYVPLPSIEDDEKIAGVALVAGAVFALSSSHDSKRPDNHPERPDNDG